MAWIGVGKQVRIGVVAREEDRQDRIIPSLRAAEDKIGWFLRELHSHGGQLRSDDEIFEIMRCYGVVPDLGQMLLRLESDLPTTDDNIRRDLAQTFVRVSASFEPLVIASSEEGTKSERRAKFLSSLQALETYRLGLVDRVAAAEARRARLREELEDFFDR